MTGKRTETMNETEQVSAQLNTALAGLEDMRQWIENTAALIMGVYTQVGQAIIQPIRARYDEIGQPFGPEFDDMLRWYREQVDAYLAREHDYDAAVRLWVIEDFGASLRGTPRPQPPERRDFGLE